MQRHGYSLGIPPLIAVDVHGHVVNICKKYEKSRRIFVIVCSYFFFLLTENQYRAIIIEKLGRYT